MAMNQGIFSRFRARLFGERDAVEDQLRDIARQGSGAARAAHLCAVLLIVLFSLGSLVALGGDALASILSQWNTSHTLDIPAAISVGVSTLLVLAMDMGMVYAALMLRLLTSRGADGAEKRLHYAVLFTVAALEAGTYGYMSWLYESPAHAVAWVLIGARACAAPLLSIYLSLARPLPVTSRDILAQAELASGKGVLRDVVTAANDTDAPLSEKMALYGASAVMAPADRARLDTMLAVVEGRNGPVRVVEALPAPKPPTGGGTPKAAKRKQSKGANVLKLTPETAESRARRVFVPGMSVTMLQQKTGMGRSAASKWRKLLEQEHEQKEGKLAL